MRAASASRGRIFDADVLETDPSCRGRLAFRHALLRETIEEPLDLGERVRLHRWLGSRGRARR